MFNKLIKNTLIVLFFVNFSSCKKDSTLVEDNTEEKLKEYYENYTDSVAVNTIIEDIDIVIDWSKHVKDENDNIIVPIKTSLSERGSKVLGYYELYFEMSNGIIQRGIYRSKYTNFLQKELSPKAYDLSGRIIQVEHNI